jgi:hypothetical protein
VMKSSRKWCILFNFFENFVWVAQQGLHANDQLTHGCNHGTLEGFSSLDQRVHIIPDDWVPSGRADRSHVEATSHFRPSSLDVALAVEEPGEKRVSPMYHDLRYTTENGQWLEDEKKPERVRPMFHDFRFTR